MTERSIDSADMALKDLFKDFYRVPNYQREYVWGESGPKGRGGEEVDQFLSDIHAEYENATRDAAPEYFIGTIVVCKNTDDVYELIDGQQRTTTSYLTLCAIRDALAELEAEVPEELKQQISATSTDWQGESVARYRLELQYEDAGGVLSVYAEGKAEQAPREGTRSIRNLGNAYETVRAFLRTTLSNDPKLIRRFYGYLTNKVKIIRIETPTVAKALKIFETINDRGVGLDAMDLLKNLLFMNAKAAEFEQLRDIWKSLTDEIYKAGEKPLRFLRYYLMANFEAENSLREDDIYGWINDHEEKTAHKVNPVKFATNMRDAAKAYRMFTTGKNPAGDTVQHLVNTRLLGGSAVRQHYILLLAGRHLSDANFRRLCEEVEKTMCVWLLSRVQAKEYERVVVGWARKLKQLDDSGFDAFVFDSIIPERSRHYSDFVENLSELTTYDVRQYRMRYLLGKLTQYVDIAAYGSNEGRETLQDYLGKGVDVEHILPVSACDDAAEEFGEGWDEWENNSRLGNLVLLESSINRSIGNGRYSEKIKAYAQSKFLLTKCQADKPTIGVADKITRTMETLESFPEWNAQAIADRQAFLAKLACTVWDVSKSRSTRAE